MLCAYDVEREREMIEIDITPAKSMHFLTGAIAPDASIRHAICMG